MAALTVVVALAQVRSAVGRPRSAACTRVGAVAGCRTWLACFEAVCAPESGHKLGLVLLQQQVPLQEGILSLPKVPQH